MGRALSSIMVPAFHRHFDPEEFDLVVPVPIHPKRLVSRGYNQTVVLGERFAAATRIPLNRFSLVKTRDTPPQVGLPKAERIKNVRGSFGVSDSRAFQGKSVLLIDDVATTGSTVAEASKAIMKADAARVCVMVLAFRPGPDARGADLPNNQER